MKQEHSAPQTSRRTLIKAAGGAGIASLAAASGSGVSRGAQDAASSWQGTITFYAQSYTPNSQLEGAVPLTAFQQVADEYQQSHPGVTIEFVDEQIPDFVQTARVRAAGKELWDVFWAQSTALNSSLPRGIARDLTPDFDQPNPYIEGNDAWRDAMNPNVVNTTAAPSGAHYNINGDFVGTAFFYNPTLFEQAGISAPPTTWPELLQVSQQLSEAGIPSATGVQNFTWFQRHFLSDFYADDYAALAGCDGAPAISALDEANAIAQGTLSTQDPRFMAWWPVFKQLTDTWNQDLLAQPADTASEQMLDSFVAGEGAMFYSGSWIPNQLALRDLSFELQSFSFPALDAEVSEYATGANTAGAVGGPNAAFQYAMSTPESNESMNEAGKQEAVLDWLHYIGTPQVIEQVVNELGSFAPTWPGTTAAPGLETFAEQANEELRVIAVGASSPELSTNIQRIFGLYLSNNAELEGAASDVQRELDRASQDYAETNGVELGQCGTATPVATP